MTLLNQLKYKLSNYNKKHVKLLTIAICATIVLIVICVSYKIFKSKIEGFALPWNQPLYKGEPQSLNPQWLQIPSSNVTFETLIGNTNYQFGLAFGTIYMYSNIRNNWVKITNNYESNPITTQANTPTTTANTQVSTRCPYGSVPIIAVNSKTLFYYNTSNNKGCLWYLPITDINTNKEWTCLPLPVNLSITDKLRLLTVNEKYLFGIGCVDTGILYYCGLDTNGKPTQINGNNWNTLQTASLPKNIQLLTCNDKGVFYTSSTTTETAQPTALDNLTTTSNKITYSSIETPNSDGTLNTNWITSWGIDDPQNTVIINNIVVNNDVAWVVDVGSRTTSTSKLRWFPLVNGLPPTANEWNYIDSPVSSIINIGIINNILVLLGSQILITRLYDPNAPTTTADAAIPTTTRSPITTRLNTTVTSTTIPLITSRTSTLSSGSTSSGGSSSSGSTSLTSGGSLSDSTSSSTGATSGSSLVTGNYQSNIGTSSNPNEPSAASESTISGADLSSLPSGNGSGTGFNVSGNSDNYLIPENNLNGLSNNYLTYTPSDNQNNMNDFISNNTLLGNNLYISPMYGTPEETGVNAGVNMSPYQNMTTITQGNTNRKISSFFFPMVKMT